MISENSIQKVAYSLGKYSFKINVKCLNGFFLLKSRKEESIKNKSRNYRFFVLRRSPYC